MTSVVQNSLPPSPNNKLSLAGNNLVLPKPRTPLTKIIPTIPKSPIVKKTSITPPKPIKNTTPSPPHSKPVSNQIVKSPSLSKSKSRSKSSSMSDDNLLLSLPTEIFEDIVKYLRPSDKCNLKKTCKTFKMIFDDLIIDILNDRQVNHYYQLKQCLLDYRFVMDTSVMGSGKTYTACAVAKQTERVLIVICPKSVISTWHKVAKVFSIGKIECYTYAHFRKSNEYLTFNKTPVIKNNKPKNKIDIEVTDAWKQKLKNNNVLLVFDECDNLKNKSIQFKAARMLALSIYGQPKTSLSAVMFLCATPIDKPEQGGRYCQLFGIIRNKKLAHYDIQNGYILDGILELIHFCNMSERDTSYYISMFNNISQKHALIEDLLKIYIKPQTFFAMPEPFIEGTLDLKNGYYKLSRQGEELLAVGLGKLMKSTGMKNPNDQINTKNVNWGDLTKALIEIEGIKIEILERKARDILDSDPNAKVVLILSYLNNIHICQELLLAYNPVVLEGKVSVQNREKLIDKFNKDPSCRVFIGNITVAATGISLHDMTGLYSRNMFIIPNYLVSKMHQATRRIHRVGSKGAATCRFVYGPINYKETSILNAISRKTQVMKDFNDDKLKDVLYPADYEIYIEP